MGQGKILLLGGSAQQVVAIDTAKRLGLSTVLCDYLPDNPGQFVADKFYQTSTTDKDAILKIAQEEQVNAIVAYASDPAAPTAAYVAEKMNLPGNPYESVNILCNKDKFRIFLSENEFNTPTAKGFDNEADAFVNINKGEFRFPIIIKPVDSSGSKGVTVLHDAANAAEAIHFAFSFTRCKRIVIEEFIEKAHPYLIGGDIHICDGKVVLWGLLNCHRDPKANPLVPVGKSYPLELTKLQEQEVHKTLQNLVTKLHIQNGAMNVELVVDAANKVWPIDVGPRNGGNMIPDLLGNIFDIDVVEMTIRGAIGDTNLPQIPEGKPFFATHNLHSIKNGVYKGVAFSSEIEQFIIKKALYKKDGDPVEFFDNAAKALGIVFFKFPDKATMNRILGNISNYISVEVV